MTIEEHIRIDFQYYNNSQLPPAWVTYPGGTVYDANVLSASIKRQCCEEGTFNIGGVFAGTLQLVCRLPGLKKHQIGNARIIVWNRYADELYQKMGVFWAMSVTQVHDIFTIRGIDAMGWTDISVPVITTRTEGYSYTESWEEIKYEDDGHGNLVPVYDDDGNPVIEEHTETFVVPDEEETSCFADQVVGGKNLFIPLNVWCTRYFEQLEKELLLQTGIRDLFTVEPYNPANNLQIESGNHYLFRALWNPETDIAKFGLYDGNGVYKTEKPREVLRWIAECMGGFFTVTRNGSFTMRQFCMPELGIAEIYDSEVEADTLEIADYYLYPNRIDVKYCNSYFSVHDGYSDAVSKGLQIKVIENPIANALIDSDRKESIAFGLYYAFVMYEDVKRVNGINVMKDADEPHIGLYKAYPVPFKAKVHKPVRFELGQTVMFRNHQNKINNYRYGMISNVPYLRSVITSVEWTFLGGQTISCGGGGILTIMQLAQDSKSDTVLRELRNRM